MTFVKTFLLMSLLMFGILCKKTIEFLGQFPKGCGFAYIAKKKIMNTLVTELDKVGIPSEYKITTSIKFSEFNILVKNKKGELSMLGTSDSGSEEFFLPYLQDSKSDKGEFIISVIERLHKLKII